MTTIRTTIFLSAFSIAIASCSPEKKAPVKKNTALIIGDQLDCGLDSLIVFPVGASYKPEIIEREDFNSGMNKQIDSELSLRTTDAKITLTTNTNSSSEFMWDMGATVEYANENMGDFDIRNLLFYNMLSGESYPLVHDSIHILSFAIHREFVKPLIFYRIVKNDYNKDEAFDNLDPVMLYVSNLDGSNFTQITPPDEHFIDYKVYLRTNSILIKTSIDSNKDLKFLANDETNFRSMSLVDPKAAENIFDKDLKDVLRKFN